jgi:hypothetical protein
MHFFPNEAGFFLSFGYCTFIVLQKYSNPGSLICRPFLGATLPPRLGTGVPDPPLTPSRTRSAQGCAQEPKREPATAV